MLIIEKKCWAKDTKTICNPFSERAAHNYPIVLICSLENNWNGWAFMFISHLVSFFNWRIIALQFGSFSAMHRHELAMAIHVPPPSWTSLPPPALCHLVDCQSPGLSFLSHSKFLLTVCLHVLLYTLPRDSPFVLRAPSSPPPMSMSLFSMSASP